MPLEYKIKYPKPKSFIYPCNKHSPFKHNKPKFIKMC